MSKKQISRRQMLQGTVGTVAGLLATRSAWAGVADACTPTTPQGTGPFYPEHDLERDADLSRIDEDSPLAKGQLIFVHGIVTDTDCLPVKGALVEIWQAAESGKYNHSADTGDLELDENFQYWGRTRTNASGAYTFKTIVPGHYPSGGGHFRPPHIHFHVKAKGHKQLTTQLYFDPESFNDPAKSAKVEELNDIESVPESLTVLFAQNPTDKTTLVGNFNIALKK